MGEKVIANKEAHEDPVINHILKVILERQAVHSQLSRKILYIKAKKNNCMKICKPS